MKRDYTTFVGIDLGGARGKTTAVAVLRADGSESVTVESVAARCTLTGNEEPWTDEALVALLDELGAGVCVAIDAPLTQPACLRCTRATCPGQRDCDDKATAWLQTEGTALIAASVAADLDRIAAVGRPSANTVGLASAPAVAPGGGAIPPVFAYVHRATEIDLHYRRGVYPRHSIGQGAGPVANRARHLRRRLRGLGFDLNDSLIEVSPYATVRALFGETMARGYKRDADPWCTRAAILESIGGELRFSPSSRLSREESLANDHCFEALLSAYTAFLYARDGWQMPAGAPWSDDGWIWAP